MAYKDGAKSGGRKPGSKNKLTLSIAQLRAKAVQTMNDALGDRAFKGDGVDFLQAIYKNPEFDFDVRMEAATRASKFERATKTESMIDDKREYIVRMPEPPKDMDDWTRRYLSADDKKGATADAEFAERIARIAASAVKKDTLQ